MIVSIFQLFLLESLRDAVGRKIKLTLKKRLKLEVKGDKLENRVLVRHHACFLGTHIIGFSLCSSLNVALNVQTQHNPFI